ncbi:MAG: isochorismate synthase [Candidatus Binatia bacterium]|nr:isochorismate synthase [Candidatus Binatia bacterium]
MTAAIPAGLIREPRFLCVGERVLDRAMDPLDFLTCVGDERAFYFERPADGVSIAAAGVVPGIEEPDRGQEPAGLRVGGFAFDRSRAPDGQWSGFPDASWSVPRVALLNRDGESVLRVAATADEGGGARVEAGLDEVVRRLGRPTSAPESEGVAHYQMEALGSVAHWKAAVEATLADIAAGRLSKLVLARAARITADVPWRRFRIARRLRAAHPGATVFAVTFGTRTLVGATPERLARLDDRRLTTAAVAGTAPPAPIGGEEDRAFLADQKERREHAVVVDELQRRLAPLTTDLVVPEAPAILTTPALRHLHTPISAELRAGRGLLDVCGELHPSPAVCGLPVDFAKEALREREQIDRGWYAGGIGWLDEGDGEVVVPLRAALLDGRVATLYAGAGIVEGSRWEAELEETRLKMRVMQAALLEL